MRILLDTHTLLWALYAPENLSQEAKALLENRENDIFVSTASLWEIENKHVKHPELIIYGAKEVLEDIAKTDYAVLPIAPNHITGLSAFMSQKIHKDPFDHLLMAVAVAEGMLLLTRDDTIASYQGVPLKRC